MNDLRDAPIIAIPGNDVEVLVSLFDVDGYPINIHSLENLRVTLFKNKKRIPLEHDCLLENHPESEAHLCLRLDAKKHIKEMGSYEIEIQFTINNLKRSSGRIDFLIVTNEVTWDDLSREIEVSSEFIRYNFKTGVGSVLNCGPKGERGESLRIKMIFPSVQIMNTTRLENLIDPDTNFPLRKGEFAIIATSSTTNDLGKIYVFRGVDQYNSGYGDWGYVGQVTSLGNYYTKLETDIESNKKVDKTSIIQTTGQSINLVMSQKSVTNLINDTVKTAFPWDDAEEGNDYSNYIVVTERRDSVPDDKGKSVTRSSIHIENLLLTTHLSQSEGSSPNLVMSQKAVTDGMNEASDRILELSQKYDSTGVKVFPKPPDNSEDSWSKSGSLLATQNSMLYENMVCETGINKADLLLKSDIVHTYHGDATDKVISQKEVRDAIYDNVSLLQEDMSEIRAELEENMSGIQAGLEKNMSGIQAGLNEKIHQLTTHLSANTLVVTLTQTNGKNLAYGLTADNFNRVMTSRTKGLLPIVRIVDNRGAAYKTIDLSGDYPTHYNSTLQQIEVPDPNVARGFYLLQGSACNRGCVTVDTTKYVARGTSFHPVVFNPITGFYKVGSVIDDIDETEMCNIYNVSPFSFAVIGSKMFRAFNLKSRTLLLSNNSVDNSTIGGPSSVQRNDATNMYQASSVMQLTDLPVSQTLQVAQSLCYYNQNLKYIYGKIGFLSPLDLTYCTRLDNAFINCSSLVEARFSKLNIAVSFPDSPLLSMESIVQMISSSAASTPITITLHAQAYAQAIANSQIQTALINNPLVTLISA